MNKHDSECIAGMLESAGHESAILADDADLIVFNTCCVREHADRRLYGQVAALKPFKKKNSDLIIAVGGCLAQLEGKALQEKLSHIDLVFGTHNLFSLPSLIEQVRSGHSRLCQIWEEPRETFPRLPICRESKIKAWIPITTGCNNFCSYCIVPYVRGREVSRCPEEIVAEVESLVKDGVIEIHLLGQNVNSYGQDLYGQPVFAGLLRRLSSVPGLARIRFATSHPKDFRDEVIEEVAGSKVICDHIHLPFQAGSTRILKAMNRGYSKEDYLRLADKIKRKIPGVSLTTDIIVGFPGETDDDFNDTLDVVRHVRFDQAFTFIYSKREGTPAALMAEQIPHCVKLERFKRLVEMQNRTTWEENQKLVDQELEILVDGKSKKGKMLSGRTETNKVVNFSDSPDRIGKLIKVRIVKAETWSLRGAKLER